MKNLLIDVLHFISDLRAMRTERAQWSSMTEAKVYAQIVEDRGAEDFATLEAGN